MNPKIIKYYRKSQYGQDREFVHPSNAHDHFLISQLINQKTISPFVRDALEKISNNSIKFEEVLAPK